MINKIRNLHKDIHYTLQERGLIFLLNRVIHRIKEVLIIPYAILRIKTTKNYTIEKSIDFSFDSRPIDKSICSFLGKFNLFLRYPFF